MFLFLWTQTLTRTDAMEVVMIVENNELGSALADIHEAGSSNGMHLSKAIKQG